MDDEKSSKLPPQQFDPNASKPRPARTRLLRAVEAGEVQAIIVPKRDRPSRPLEMTLWLYRYLDRFKIQLLCTHESGFSNDATGTFSLQQLALVADFELRRIPARPVTAIDQKKGFHQ